MILLQAILQQTDVKFTWQLGDRKSHSRMVLSSDPERNVSSMGDMDSVTTLKETKHHGQVERMGDMGQGKEEIKSQWNGICGQRQSNSKTCKATIVVLYCCMCCSCNYFNYVCSILGICILHWWCVNVFVSVLALLLQTNNMCMYMCVPWRGLLSFSALLNPFSCSAVIKVCLNKAKLF